MAINNLAKGEIMKKFDLAKEFERRSEKAKTVTKGECTFCLEVKPISELSNCCRCSTKFIKNEFGKSEEVFFCPLVQCKQCDEQEDEDEDDYLI